MSIARKREIVAWLIAFRDLHGRGPTLAEIGQRFGFKISRASYLISKLERDGFVVRGIQVTPQGVKLSTMQPLQKD
jgi:DNA-binding MarR family transcriptional regulator